MVFACQSQDMDFEVKKIKTSEDIEEGLKNGVQYLNLHPRPHEWKEI